MTIRNLTNRLLEALRLQKIPEPDDADWLIPQVWHGKSTMSLSFDGAVTQIEVEKIVPPSEEDWDAETYYRVIRFTTNTGEVLEVACSAYSGDDLRLVEVDELGPVQPVSSRSQRNWLTPQRSTRKAG